MALKKYDIGKTKYLKDCSLKEMGMIQARYDGTPLKKIAEDYGYNHDISVANLFNVSGRLSPAYNEYKGIMHQAFLEESVNLLKKAVSPATKVLINKLQSGDEKVSFGAAKYVIDREMGRPKEMVEHSGEMPLQIVIKGPQEPERKQVDADGTDK